MTKDQALTLALKQLEFFDRSSHQHGCVWQKHLITAIKEALAQPERPWVGLTDEELAEISASGLVLWGLWRAIEAKLKEKNFD